MVCVLLFAGPAHAGHATARPQVTLSDRAKPPPRRDGGAAPPTADQLLGIEGLLAGVRLEQAGVLRDLIARTGEATPEDAMEKADYYVRLAELSARAARLHRLQGAEAELALAKAPERHAALSAEIARHKAEADAATLDVIEVYRALLERSVFARYPRLDAAVFYYGDTLAHAGHRAQAIEAYERLIKGYPGSRFVGDAYVALGDAAFEAGVLGDAAERYRKAIAVAAPGLAGYARYKLGWVAFSERRFADALDGFAQVVTTPKLDDALRRAAAGDLVRAYAEIGRAERALALFRRVAPADAYGMLERLGQLYADHGKDAAAIWVFRQLMHDQPASPRACAWQHAVARSTLVIGKPAEKVGEIEQLVRLYAAIGARLPAAEAAECHDAAAEMADQLARAFHQEAVKTLNPESFALADRLYRAYLGAFPDAADHGEAAYFRAELGWSAAERDPRARWEDVAAAFTEVVDARQVSPALLRVAADAAVQAWLKVAQEPASDDDPVRPQALSEKLQQLLAALDRYLQNAPADDEQRVGVMFLKANLLRKHGHLAEAIPMFEDIVAHHPTHETAEYAAQLVLDSDHRLGRVPEMMAFARGLSPAFLAAHPAVAEVVGRLEHVTQRMAAQHLEHEAQRTGQLSLYVACGERYLAMYNAAPEANDAGELLYNAGVCLEMGKTLGGAITVYETLEKLMPTAPVAARALARLGDVYAMTAQYREAAVCFERYAGRYAGEADAGQALSEAVQYRRGIGDDAQAIADTQRFVATFGGKRTAEAADAVYSLIAIYEKQADARGLDALARHLRAYLDRYGAVGGAARRVIAWAKLGDVLWRQACPVAVIDGVCAREVREVTARGARCGDDARVVLRIVPRDAAKLRAAIAAFDQAISAYEGRGAGGDRSASGDRAALYYAALARFTRAERDYEAYLAIALPVELDFDPARPAIAARSRARFDAWVTAKADAGSRLRDGYEAMAKLGDGAIAIAARTRIAAISQHAASQLYRAEIPAQLRRAGGEAPQAYCDALEQRAQPLEASALSYYQACLSASTQLGWFSQWSRICERELGRLLPAEFPSTLELRREPTAVSMITEPER